MQIFIGEKFSGIYCSIWGTNTKAMTNYKVVFDYSYGIICMNIHETLPHRSKPLQQEESLLTLNSKSPFNQTSLRRIPNNIKSSSFNSSSPPDGSFQN